MDICNYAFFACPWLPPRVICGVMCRWNWDAMCDVYSVYLGTRAQDFPGWSSISCKDYRIEVQVAFCFPQVESFCFLCYWLSFPVPLAVAHCLFIGCLVWKNIQSFSIDKKSEQRSLPITLHCVSSLPVRLLTGFYCTWLSSKFGKSDCGLLFSNPY